MALRIYLAGRVCIEANGVLLDQEAFPARQGRLAFAYLILERRRSPLREQLAEELWPDALPPAWGTALNSIISRLRALVTSAGLRGTEVIGSNGSQYDVRLPSDAWIDLEAGLSALHEAEGTLATGNHRLAYGQAQVAYQITKRAFLPGQESPWIQRQRERLREAALRSIECVGSIYLANNEPVLAIDLANEAIAIEPFRETAYQLLMKANLARGNRAEALRVYERCRRLIADELGADPSSETQQLHMLVLGN